MEIYVLHMRRLILGFRVLRQHSRREQKHFIVGTALVSCHSYEISQDS
jgi:hypothetical protein